MPESYNPTEGKQIDLTQPDTPLSESVSELVAKGLSLLPKSVEDFLVALGFLIPDSILPTTSPQNAPDPLQPYEYQGETHADPVIRDEGYLQPTIFATFMLINKTLWCVNKKINIGQIAVGETYSPQSLFEQLGATEPADTTLKLARDPNEPNIYHLIDPSLIYKSSG